ncbi:MAG: Asp-tRNA(Asn)/Glu-tRNA(Gln) amidotransferase subunit GatB [Ignavibacteriae bacterium]|nr:Asp-tRNA(Asn)/Glu-tRNA(Gln) amidotransferase subunit GatB [Ignavibacteriota bacterium]
MSFQNDSVYEPVIGLEVHAQLLTNAKVFCSCSTKFGHEPNVNICPVCLGMPGVLPVLNKQVVEFVMKMGLATNCAIAHHSVFARKNYFYPDLPKGYQISQFEEPICSNGFVEIELEDGSRKKIGLTRIHMEEDAGKSIHDMDADTLIDVNRCGTPLAEIVSEPDMRTAREAYLYLYKIRQIVTYLGVCDGIMEEGSLRCDANVSVRKKGDTKLGTKVEVKNMNSFRNVDRAIEYEINRQIGILEDGGKIIQETLLWDADKSIAYSMRGKEESHDYRYFPDPDLVPVVVNQEWIHEIQQSLPEHPTTRRDRFVQDLGLPKYDADILTSEKGYADYFEFVLNELTTHHSPLTNNYEQAKQVSNWVMTDVLRVVGERKININDFPISAKRLASMIQLINDGTISGKIAKDIFEEMLNSDKAPKTIVEEKGWNQISDTSAIEKVVEEILAKNQTQVEQYRSGNEKVLGFFVGQTMKAMGGKANPSIVNEILKKKLSS